MQDDDKFQVRPGYIRSKRAQRVRPFIHQALAAAQKAGATVRQGRLSSSRSKFGRGQPSALIANRLLSNRSRLAVIKARVIRHRGRATPLKTHLRYLQRDGVTREGDKAALIGPDRDGVDGKAFAERCADDRHHFRFIVSPEDAVEMEDLNRFTRDLMKTVETDLGTSLDWVAIAHWNTEHPHVHILVRGITDKGGDLVISRDYIKEGLRARAQLLITDELGLRTERDILHSLQRQVDAERFTQLDRQLLADARRDGFIDLAPDTSAPPHSFQVLKAGRIRKLESLGLADQFAPGQWLVSERTEDVLRDLGERGDIIKRIHHELAQNKLERSSATFGLEAQKSGAPIVGRLLARGLDDELKGTAYLIVDGIDGRTHYVAAPSLEHSGDASPGSILTVNPQPHAGTSRTTVRVESDHDLETQISANGATWLDRQLVKADPGAMSHLGFGAEVRVALQRRSQYLLEQGLASRVGEDLRLAPDLLQTLRKRELDQVAEALRKGGVRAVAAPGPGDPVAGIYRRRLDLVSGRFAVLDTGLGFALVPWSPKLEPYVGEPVAGQMRSRSAVTWELGRAKAIGIEI